MKFLQTMPKHSKTILGHRISLLFELQQDFSFGHNLYEILTALSVLICLIGFPL